MSVCFVLMCSLWSRAWLFSPENELFGTWHVGHLGVFYDRCPKDDRVILRLDAIFHEFFDSGLLWRGGRGGGVEIPLFLFFTAGLSHIAVPRRRPLGVGAREVCFSVIRHLRVKPWHKSVCCSSHACRSDQQSWRIQGVKLTGWWLAGYVSQNNLDNSHSLSAT